MVISISVDYTQVIYYCKTYDLIVIYKKSNILGNNYLPYGNINSSPPITTLSNIVSMSLLCTDMAGTSNKCKCKGI